MNDAKIDQRTHAAKHLIKLFVGDRRLQFLSSGCIDDGFVFDIGSHTLNEVLGQIVEIIHDRVIIKCAPNTFFCIKKE